MRSVARWPLNPQQNTSVLTGQEVGVYTVAESSAYEKATYQKQNEFPEGRAVA
jgi:hypothetical protein